MNEAILIIIGKMIINLTNPALQRKFSQIPGPANKLSLTIVIFQINKYKKVIWNELG